MNYPFALGGEGGGGEGGGEEAGEGKGAFLC